MSIRPVDFNGMIQNQQEVGTVKQQEDSKPALIQQQTANAMEKKQESHMRQVESKDDMAGNDFQYDARDKSKNEYSGQGQNKDKKKKEQMEDGHVRVKGRSGGFDVTI